MGLHPWYQAEHWIKTDGTLDTRKMDADFAQFEALLSAHKELIWAIGETGFDLHKTPPARKQFVLQMQRVAFEFCIGLAERKNLPLIVHSRNSWQATMETLREKRKNAAVLIHCYGGSAENISQFHNKKIYASFGGPVTWQNSKNVREAARRCPAEALMIETDAPDLPPETDGARPARNEPHMLCEIAKAVAAVRQCEVEKLSEQCDANLMRWLHNS
jgi:TatD DNase family protein